MGEQGEGGAGAWPLAAGTVLGKYRIVRLVGEGGMGAVYEALHLEIGKRVAVKAMSPALAAIPEARARFVREAQVTSRVRHPHVIDITDIGCEARQPFMVMEYLEGEDLAKHIARRGPLAIEESADIALPLLAAVGAAHEEGIVHRDLKPQNVFLAEMRDGTLRATVLDFGISKAPPQLAGDAITTAGGLLGSPSYFAPEQVNDSKSANAASDQYALGVILYECVAGRSPYEGSSLPSIFRAILRGHYFPARTHRPDLPEGFAAVIARAMSIDPAGRYPCLTEMGRALLPFASEKARVVWSSHFESDPARSGAGAFARVRAPVTDQMPAPMSASGSASGSVPHSVTASFAGAGQVGAGDLASSSAADIASSEVSLAIPRVGRAAWALAGLTLAAAGILGAVALHGRRDEVPQTARQSAPPAARPSVPAMAAPREVPAPAGPARAAVPEPTRRPATDDAEGLKTAPAPRHGRQARMTRFGPNRAPLIE